MDFDVVIVGGGPAGLTAGIYCIRRGLKAVVVERNLLGGNMQRAAEIENWPGDNHVSGSQLSERMAGHAKSLGVQFKYNEVLALTLEGELKKVTLRDGELTCSAIILATGGKVAKLKIKGEDEYSGKGVSYCATCDGPLFKDKAVVIAGSGNMAVEDALYLSELASKTFLISKELKADNSLIEKLESSSVEVIADTLTEITGTDFVESVKLSSGGELHVGGVFICGGHTASSELAGQSGVELDKKGFIRVDRDMRTNIAGVFAAGDVTGGIPQITVAAGEGATAALKAYEHVKS